MELDSSPGGCAASCSEGNTEEQQSDTRTLFCMNLLLLTHSDFFLTEECWLCYWAPCEFLRNGQSCCFFLLDSAKCQDAMLSSALIMWGYSNTETLTDCEMVSAFSAFLPNSINSETQAVPKPGLEETEPDFLLL